MPRATNPVDGVRTFFEDSGGAGPPLLFYAARRAAEEIPGARFVSLAGHSHISAFYEGDELLLPHILELLRSAASKE